MKTNTTIDPQPTGKETPELFPKPKPPKPTDAQVAEVITPSLSRDSFKVGDHEIPIRILPYSTEKKMVLAIEPMIKKIVELIATDGGDGGKQKSYLDILKENGTSLVIEFADELFRILHVICQKYQEEISLEYVMDNVNLYRAWDVLIRQMEKNQMGDLVTSFFMNAATLLPRMNPKAESPES